MNRIENNINEKTSINKGRIKGACVLSTKRHTVEIVEADDQTISSLKQNTHVKQSHLYLCKIHSLATLES